MGKQVHKMLSVNPETKRGTCAACGEEVPIKRHLRKDGTVRYACRRATYQWKRPETRSPTRKRLRLTNARVAAMLAQQGGECAICRRGLNMAAEPRFVLVDHDHETGVFRAILCPRCNQLLGILSDSSVLASQAAAYLRAHGR